VGHVNKFYFKGTVSGSIHESSFPGPLIIPLATLNLFKTREDIGNTRGHHIFPKIYIGGWDTRRKFAKDVNDTCSNLPPVSMTPAVNCHQCQWHRRSIVTIISDCLHLTVNWTFSKKNLPTNVKCYPIVSLQNMKKTFYEAFFYLLPVSLTSVVHLEKPWLSPWFLKINQNIASRKVRSLMVDDFCQIA
jgi:hypothetical protein